VTRTARLAALVAAASLAASSSLHAQAGLLVPSSSGRPDASVLALREMAVDVGLARGYARVNVRQVFENRTGLVQEGTYRFRLPPSAAVGDFAVWDDLVRVPGVILEKQRARAIYDELTRQRIDPGLLQQGEEDEGARVSSGAAFSARVAPIPPWATKRLEMQFQQEVPLRESRGEFRLALRPDEGEPPVAGTLQVRVRLEDGELLPSPDALALRREGSDLVFAGTDVRLDRDLVVSVGPGAAPPLRLTAFRNPEGTLPDGLALAPWERPSEIPPERDGFFLLEMMPRGAPTPAAPSASSRPPVSLAVLFDTSLSVRWSGLETAYARLVRLLETLTARDRFAVVAFDRTPDADARLSPATPEAVAKALEALRGRPLRPGSDVAGALALARRLVGDGGRILLLTDGPPAASSALAAARGALALFTALSGEEIPEAYRVASKEVLAPGASDVEEGLFLRRVVSPAEAERTTGGPLPFRVTGGEPKLRDVYAVLAQPLAAGALSGWVGRYAEPAPRLQWEALTPLIKDGRLDAPLPERALEARDLPRRWARARVDHLLLQIEAEGEKREWVDEVIALSKRYKFVTPYTAFLAAPRSLLRPRRIQPGDPVLRVECDPMTRAVTALFPFGLRLPLVRRPGTTTWEGRFLVPEGLADGRYTVRLAMRDASGAHVSESKTFVLDGRAPHLAPESPSVARPGDAMRVAVRTDEDVVLLSVRLGDGAPVPLRWDAAEGRSVGVVRVPSTLHGAQELFFEAVDGAKNRGFARRALLVQP
jgi:Ca-activated chloride channel family protein